MPSTARWPSDRPDLGRPTSWGGEGSLWTPHVYMPAQNPGDPSGHERVRSLDVRPVVLAAGEGRQVPADRQPLLRPGLRPDTSQPFCEPAQIPSTPNVSVGMEAFNDTPIVNGTAYPTTTVDPKAYRFRILNAANDRFWNLSVVRRRPDDRHPERGRPERRRGGGRADRPERLPDAGHEQEPEGPGLDPDRHRGRVPAGPGRRPGPADHLDHRSDPVRRRQRRPALAAAGAGRAGRRDRRLLAVPRQDADPLQRRPRGLPGPRAGLRLLHRRPGPVARPARRPRCPATARTPAPSCRSRCRTAAPALAFDRPNTTADRMGALQAAFAHHLDASGKPAGVFESGSDPIIVGQAAYNSAYGTSFVASGWCNSPTQPGRQVRRVRPDPKAARPTDQFKFDTLAGTAAGDPAASRKGMHDEMNSANFDEWGRMTANLGLEAPGATPLLQNIILYPYVNPATEILDATGHAEQPRRDADLLGGRRHPDLEDHPQRRGHPPDPLPPVRRAGDQPGHLGQHHHPARPDRARLEGHGPGQPARGHHRRGAADRADAAVRRPRQPRARSTR